MKRDYDLENLMEEMLSTLKSKNTDKLKNLEKSMNKYINRDEETKKKYQEYMNKTICTIKYSREGTEIEMHDIAKFEIPIMIGDIMINLLEDLEDTNRMRILIDILDHFGYNPSKEDDD